MIGIIEEHVDRISNLLLLTSIRLSTQLFEVERYFWT
jgi:hypothetical protein